MGLIEVLRGKRVYFDTNIFIYLIEGSATYQTQIDIITDALERNTFEAFSSHITLTEILPPLVRNGDEYVISGTIEFIRDSGIFSLNAADEEICIQAGFLRGKLGMKTPDAIHVASAVHSRCNVFFTNDAGIKVPSSMQRILLSDFV